MSLTSRPRRPGPSVRVRVDQLTTDGDQRREDRLATEEPLELRLTWPGRPAERAWVTMRTPGHDFELAAGWAVHEGLTSPDGIRGVAYCTDVALAPDEEFNVVTLTLADAPPRPARLARRHEALSAGSSACGVCGRESVGEVLETAALVAAPRWDGPLPDADVVRRLPDALREHQPLFSRTGGVHAAGLATATGDLVCVREDVGRHNAVDKVVGARVLAGEAAAQACLVVSGRAGFELVQKGLAAGVGALVSVGAPTSLAVDLARSGGMALFGFTRGTRTVRYC